LKLDAMERKRDEATALRERHSPLAVRNRLAAKPAPSYLQDFFYGAVDRERGHGAVDRAVDEVLQIARRGLGRQALSDREW